MSLDWVPWVIRAILIVVGITIIIMVSKWKKEGRLQERYYLSFVVIGITALIMGVILLLISIITDLSFDYAMFLTAVGAIGIIIGLVIRNTWRRTVNTSGYPQTPLT